MSIDRPIPYSSLREMPMSLQAGLEALKERRPRDAVQILKDFSQYYTQRGSKDYIQAQMALVKAYHLAGETEKAIAIAQELAKNENSQVNNWAKQFLVSLTGIETPETKAPFVGVIQKASRARQGGVKLTLSRVAGNLALASGVTISLLFGMVLALSLAVVFIVGSDNPTSGLAIAVSFTLIFNIAAFFLSPLIMDLTQSWLYKTRWVSLEDVESQSPEAAMVIQQV